MIFGADYWSSQLLKPELKSNGGLLYQAQPLVEQDTVVFEVGHTVMKDRERTVQRLH